MLIKLKKHLKTCRLWQWYITKYLVTLFYSEKYDSYNNDYIEAYLLGTISSISDTVSSTIHGTKAIWLIKIYISESADDFEEVGVDVTEKEEIEYKELMEGVKDDRNGG